MQLGEFAGHARAAVAAHLSKQQLANRSGEWLVYNRNARDPDEIFPVYKKNNILFVNKEMIPFREKGYCWDGENSEGKYQLCVQDILSTYTTSNNLVFDSVYVYSQQHYNLPDSVVSTLYVSALYPVILKTVRTQGNQVVEVREITSFELK